MQKYKLIISIIGTVIMIYVMSVTGKGLKTTDTPYGIIDLEFANTAYKAEKVLNAWKGDLITTAKVNTYWDFLFLLFYGFLLFNICQWLCNKQPFTWIGKMGVHFSKLSIIVAVLDVVENVVMLKVLTNHYQEWHLVVMSTVSYIKWLSVLIIIAYCIIGFVSIFLKKRK